MRKLFILILSTIVLFAGDVTLKGTFKKGSSISIEHIVNHETNEKKVLKKIDLPDGKLEVTLNIPETCQLELYGNDGSQALGSTYIYVENGGIYTLAIDQSGAKGFIISKEENSSINTTYKNVEKEFFGLAQNFSPDFGKVEFWQNKTADVLKKNNVKKGSYLEKLITYLYASNELSMPIGFALRAKDKAKAKKLITDFEKKYFSGKKENISTYYMTLSSMNRMKRRMN